MHPISDTQLPPLIPPYLQPGDTIGITCPAGYVSFERVAPAIKVLQDWGYQVRVGDTVGTEYHYFSGDDACRRNDLQSLLDDTDVKAILMGRGGYGMSRIIDGLDFSTFVQHPKWLCGFSDITVLHNHVHALYQIPTMHSPMCGAFTEKTSNAGHILQFKSMLCGDAVSHIFPPSQYNRAGTATAVLTGGNLAILAHLTGSISAVDTRGKILFIEDVGEHYYNIDRLLLNLKRAGKLDHLAALLVGSFTDMQDTERPFGQHLEEIVWDKVKEYNYPVAFHFPCGHQEINYTLGLGLPYRLSVFEDHSLLEKL